VRNVKGLVPEIALRFLAYNRPQAARMRTYGAFRAQTGNLGLP
jgi:hypothetical protein